MRKNRWTLAASVVGISLLLLTTLLFGCAKKVLKEVPADVVPETYKEALRQHEWDILLEDTVVWRVCEDYGDYLLVACTYEVDFRGTRSTAYRMWATSSSGEWSTGWGGGFGSQGATQFGAWLSPVANELAVIDHMDVGGHAWDARVAKIRVVMTDGSTAETEPVDGFWVLPFGIDVTDEEIDEVLALSAKGGVVYRQKNNSMY